MSTRSLGQRYTAQGLGDRIHLISLCYEIAIKKSEVVTLHLARNHFGGDKRASFLEIAALFPSGLIELAFHEHEFVSAAPWKSYLDELGISAHSFSYSDHPGWLEKQEDFAAEQFLFRRNLIYPSCSHKLDLPEKFITSQWDSTGADRLLPRDKVSEIEGEYRNLGLDVVVVGGASKNNYLRDCLGCCAIAIRKSIFFIGVDSGFMHLSLQLKEPRKIHLYTARNRYWSHHTFRAIEMGVQLNVFSKKVSWADLLYVKLRYDSPQIARIIHRAKQRIGIERHEDND